MDKKSLYLIRKAIIEKLSVIDIPQIDRVEGMVNALNFFSDDDYEENIKVLQKHKTLKKKL